MLEYANYGSELYLESIYDINGKDLTIRTIHSFHNDVVFSMYCPGKMTEEKTILLDQGYELTICKYEDDLSFMLAEIYVDDFFYIISEKFESDEFIEIVKNLRFNV